MVRKERDYRIDNIRAIGLLLLFLAHSQVSGLLNEIRSFDVIMLVFISGLMVKPDRLTTVEGYKAYAKKRFQQLIVPTYLTITFVLLISFIVCLLAHRAQLFSLSNVINSYLLCEESVGYVWIIKVYLVNALAVPLFKWLNDRCIENWKFAIMLVLEYALYVGVKVLYTQYGGTNQVLWIVVHEWIMTCIPYGIIGQIAFRYIGNKSWQKQSILYAAVLFLVIQSILLVNGNGFAPSLGKRPVDLSYLSYGLLVALLMMKVIPNRKVRLLSWISQNSLSLYLVHIFVVMALSFMGNRIDVLMHPNAFVIRFIIISASTSIAYWCMSTCRLKIKELRGI